MKKKIFNIFFLFLTALFVVYGVICFFVAFSSTKALRRPLADSLNRTGGYYEEVLFLDRKSEVELRGWLLPAENPLGAIIFVHGLDSNRADPDVGLVDLATELKNRGFSILMFDLRGHGISGDGRLSGGFFEQEDILGAYDYLLEMGYKPGNIGVLGISLGAATSILAAAREPGIVAVVADSPFTDIKEVLVNEIPKRVSMPEFVAQAIIPGTSLITKWVYGIDLNAVAPVNVADQFKYPIFLVHCAQDERIPPEHSYRIWIKSTNDSSFLFVNQCFHAGAFKARKKEYVKKISVYFSERLIAPNNNFWEMN